MKLEFRLKVACLKVNKILYCKIAQQISIKFHLDLLLSFMMGLLQCKQFIGLAVIMQLGVLS